MPRGAPSATAPLLSLPAGMLELPSGLFVYRGTACNNESLAGNEELVAADLAII